MPAEADLFSLKIFFSSQNSKAMVFHIGVILYEVFDIIEVLVDTLGAVVS